MDEEDDTETVYMKYIVDGAISLSEIVVILRNLVDELENKDKEGWELNDQVDGGWVCYRKKDA